MSARVSGLLALGNQVTTNSSACSTGAEALALVLDDVSCADCILAPDELRSLVARCDKLLPEVEKLEPSERKVFTRRLQACRNLYQFMLDSK